MQSSGSGQRSKPPIARDATTDSQRIVLPVQQRTQQLGSHSSEPRSHGQVPLLGLPSNSGDVSGRPHQKSDLLRKASSYTELRGASRSLSHGRRRRGGGGGGGGRGGVFVDKEEEGHIEGTVNSKSAAVSKLEREVSELKTENSSLKRELAELKTLYEQLVHEAPLEMFDERRVHLLKSQVVQLERQVILQMQALGSRADMMLELQTMLDTLLAKLSCQPGRGDGAQITLSPNEVEGLTSQARAVKRRLSRRGQTSSPEDLVQPLSFLEHWIRPGRKAGSESPVSLLDVCVGSTEHLNLKHINRLESNLAELYRELRQLQGLLQTVPNSGYSTPVALHPLEGHLTHHVTKSCKTIGECCHNLLCLSLLVPAAPWPALKGREVALDLRAKTILEKLPPSLRNRKEAKEVIEAAAKSFSYHSNMQETKCRALEDELRFHKDVYQLQINYVESLFTAMRSGYQTFEESAQDLICQPLDVILQAYHQLSQTASNDALKCFLTAFQENEKQLKMAVESLQRPQAQGSHPQEAFSEFGNHFFESLRELEEECSKRREQLLRDLETTGVQTASTQPDGNPTS